MILVFLIPLPEWRFVFPLLGVDVELYFSALSQLGVLVAALACVGTDAVMRAHPRVQGRSLAYTLTFCPLPASLVALSLSLLSGLRWWSSRFVLIALTGLMLAFIVVLERHSVGTVGAARDLSSLVLNAATYVMALLAFSVLCGARTQAVLAAAGAFLVGTSLALRPLRQEHDLGRVWLYAALTGFAMGEVMWALTYYPLSASVGGALLLLVFYTITTASQRELSDGLQRRDVIEMVAVFGIGLAFLVGHAQGLW